MHIFLTFNIPGQNTWPKQVTDGKVYSGISFKETVDLVESRGVRRLRQLFTLQLEQEAELRLTSPYFCFSKNSKIYSLRISHSVFKQIHLPQLFPFPSSQLRCFSSFHLFFFHHQVSFVRTMNSVISYWSVSQETQERVSPTLSGSSQKRVWEDFNGRGDGWLF